MTFDPSEPRDEHGKWTGSGPHPSGVAVAVLDPKNIEKADAIAKIAADTARRLDFDPKHITISDESKTFELNGKTLHYAGAAFLDSHTENPEIALYTPHVDPASAHGVAAHEIAHQKYQALLNDYRKERERMEQDPDYHKDSTWVKFDPNNPLHAALKASGSMVTTDGQIREKGFMNPDGLLNEPYASRYPLYQKYNEVAGGTSKGTSIADFAKSDGVSGYSKEYWEGWHNSKIGTPSAMHETIAEMSRLKYDRQRDLDAHKETIRYIKANGGTWTAEDEKQWKQGFNSRQRNGYQNYRLATVEGKKMFLSTLTSVRRKNWEDLYDLVDWNWKRRNKK